MSGKFNQVYGIDHTKESTIAPPNHDCSRGAYMRDRRI